MNNSIHIYHAYTLDGLAVGEEKVKEEAEAEGGAGEQAEVAMVKMCPAEAAEANGEGIEK